MAKRGSIFLNLAKDISPKKIEAIISFLGDPDEILQVNIRDLRIPSLTERDIYKIIRLRESEALDEELKLIDKNDISVIDIFDGSYPSLLKEIAYPPLVLYVKGNILTLNKSLFAIVGTRIPTIYGISMAEEFSYKLSSLGLVVVSGLARGIDSVVHKAAIKKGESVAVLGSGLLNIYPPENKRLADKISEKGAVISEFSFKEPPLRENFPRRNRIISGLSKGVLIIEAGLRSGALITAHLAIEQNREVFALPGKADSPLSKGTHILIKEGAKLVDCVEDILEELNIRFEEQENNFNLTSQEKVIFDIIDREGVYLEEVISKSSFGPSIVSKSLLGLQVKGLIREVKPSCFAKVR
jgi:DNA processing protein